MVNAHLKIKSMAEVAAADWFRRQSADLMASMYLYYKPGEIAFWIGEDGLNEKWKLARPERILPCYSPRDVVSIICNVARMLPILPKED